MGNVRQYGLWPGVVAIVGDADMYCVPCAKWMYGAAPVQRVIDGEPGYDQYTDHEGNVFVVVRSGSQDLHGQHCGWCHGSVCEEECICYQPGQAEHWQHSGEFLEVVESGELDE